MTETQETTFTAIDRCDACGAQAWVKAKLPTGELYFCAHHARGFADKLQGVATQIIDQTDRLHEEEHKHAPLTAMR